MLTAIRNWVIRTMMKSKGETGIVRTLPNKDIVELNTQITAQRLMQNGIDPQSLKNADQVENAIISIERRNETMSMGEARGEGIKSAKIFDMEGKEIPKGSKIMGGKEVKETEAEMLARINRENKKGIEGLKQKMRKEKARTQRISGNLRANNANRTEIGKPKLDEDEYDYYKEILGEDPEVDYYPVKGDETKEMLDAMVKEAKDEMDYMKRLYDKGALDPPEDFAQGGRAGFANGTGAPSIKYDFDREQGPMGPVFETDDPKEAAKEILKRLIRIDDAGIPISKNISLLLGTNPSVGIGGEVPLFGGGLKFGAGKDVVSGEEQFDLRYGKGLNNGSLEFGIGKGEEGIGGGLTLRKKFNQGGRAGFFLGSANPKGLGLLRKILNYMSKTGKEQDKFKGADLSGLDMLRLSNPKRFNRLLEDVRGKVNIKEGIMGTDTVRAMQQAEREKRKNLVEKSLDVAKAMKADDDKIKIRLAKEAETTIIPQVKKQLMEGMGMSEEAAEKAARDMAEAAQNMRPLNAPPEITEEGLLQLENVLKNLETGGKKKRELNATGGRIGFKDGMTRRTFLKIFGGLVSLPIIGKVLAPLKLTKGVSKVPIIKTDNVPGKPEWFDQLVNKVIIEGDDVTKRFATGERQSIHQKTLDDGSVVRVTEDIDDGAVRVEYESKESMFGEPVQMQYKKPKPDEGDPSPTAEFEVSESGIVGKADGPDDFVLEGEDMIGSSIKELESDVSKLKQYATGKGPTMKEIVEIKKRKDKVRRLNEGDPSETSQYVTDRQGDYDPSPDDFASGGIARMLGE